MLSGYKTYVLAGVAVIGAIASYLVGDASLQDAIQIGLTAVIGATVRAGVTSEVKKAAK